ncbi:FXYD domain-containing ion transport regulator 1, isoform CRA_a [Rattus norvegicus]|uniref:FXYD domain-containing ion transport regulator 1, isoform CRA_a n=1 Tax=Rattus norvegicus TaxID=10116 RepID=A6JA51_RAT|nr:FXYD domain-containing ion transport regulator 1, isoform CRA_a [Rattus norvegicus]
MPVQIQPTAENWGTRRRGGNFPQLHPPSVHPQAVEPPPGSRKLSQVLQLMGGRRERGWRVGGRQGAKCQCGSVARRACHSLSSPPQSPLGT